MYDPTNGVWVSEDPIGFEAGDDNLTRYVGNDPTNATDPSGLQELLDSKSTDAAFTDPSPYYDGTEEPDKATYPIAHIFVTTQLEPLTKDAALFEVDPNFRTTGANFLGGFPGSRSLAGVDGPRGAIA